MAWEWLPETPEEIAEHRRMRRELQKCQQIYDSSDNSNSQPRKKSVLLRILVIFTICVVGYNVLSFFNNEKSVSQNAGSYIQQTKIVNGILNSFLPRFLDDFADDGKINYVTHEKDIDRLLLEIETLQNKSIFRFDALYKYQTVCEIYYGRVYSFFNSVKFKQEISVDDYNQYCIELNLLSNPIECLIELFEKYGFYYSISSNGDVYYNSKKYFIS